MPDIYHSDQEAIEQAEAARAAEDQAMDTKITEAEPAVSGTVPEILPSSDFSTLEAEIGDRQFPSVTEADSRVADSTPVSDRLGTTDVAHPAEKAALAGQMTDTPHFNQNNHPDCLLQSGRMVEARLTGVDPGLEVYKNEAIRRGSYHEASGKGGIDNMEKFAEQMNDRPGLETKYHEGANLSDIKDALDHGQSLIVGVDAAKFYPEAGLEPNSGGHAVVVTGVEQDLDGRWHITVNDPNEFEPNTLIRGETFTSAWRAFNSPMIMVSKA